MKQPIRVVFRTALERAPAAGQGLRIALYQGQGAVGSEQAVGKNLERLDEVAALAAAYGAQVCVFPEKYTTGYAIDAQQCRQLAEHSQGPSVEQARLAAKENNLAVVLPYPERDGERFYDAISLIAADGQVTANYRKTHLYGAAERRNYSAGEELPPVVDINGIKVGVLNCYECEFPPLYQYLAEQGAKVVLGPTAADFHFRLADGRMTQVPYQDATRHIIPAMAGIWRLFIAYANRRGWEQVPAGAWQYRGNSGIWGPDGEPLIAATPEDRQEDCLLIADCVPASVPPFSPEGNHLTDNRLTLNTQLRQTV
ncbi:nitrilase-related carbon-nitrogen hydrolase [Streptomyces sp. SID12488]|uniref:nitrilase-related carbon-nitrogen hydrolase n=1 Tax=Streptomyces sp. SID12488 TaxID=2706040 RepID=UPI0013DCDEFA|nr:nitrilase-related carbon-nitrogen hydrolase [Streptomyces sp. SID12488]NEA63332.1 carbon-nitrogen hydrolase [Streptomyces sp. SID12488]